MKKQKHFNSERSIMAEIYKQQRRQNELLKEAEACDARATHLSQESLKRSLSEDEVNALGWERKQAQSCRNSINRIESVVDKLRATKSAFDTITLPGIVEGGDVVLQK